MRKLCFFTVLVLAVAPWSSVLGQNLRDGLAASQSFALALGADLSNSESLARLAQYDVVVVDGENASVAQIAVLKQNGVIVLGYLSVGTIEPWRSWYPLLKRYRGKRWDDWGEYYAKVKERGFRRAITTRIVPLLIAKGFDGLFLDNTDAYSSGSQLGGMYALIQEISAVIDRYGLLLFTQNGEATLLPVLRHFDGWNREDVTFTFDFDASSYQAVSPTDRARALFALQLMRAFGLFVSATDYTGAEGLTSSAARDAACAAGASSYVSNIELTRLEPPYVCP